MRQPIVVLHRVVGLTMALFLVVAGLTGSLLVWYEEIYAAVNPGWLRIVPPTDGQAPLDPLQLRAAVLERYPQASIHYLTLHGRADRAAVFWLQAGDGKPLAVDTVFVDRYTGKLLGARHHGEIGEGIHNLAPFLYELHRSLALGKTGKLLLGIVALLWTIDCFAGAWLTFPAPARRPANAGWRNWLRRWGPAWKLRWQAGSYKRNYDLHRAGGLWPWALLFVFAWSSVAFNLPEVYTPVMNALFDHQPEPRTLAPRLPRAQPQPGLDWPAALARARQLMAAESRTRGFVVHEESSLRYDPRSASFHYRVRSQLDVNEKRGNTTVVFDANDGRQLGSFLPSGTAGGDSVSTWLLTLHLTHLWGMPYRLAATAIGIIVAMLSITGIYLWWKKRRARRMRASKSS